MNTVSIRIFKEDYSLSREKEIERIKELYPFLFGRRNDIIPIGFGTRGAIFFEEKNNPQNRALKLGLTEEHMHDLRKEYKNHVYVYEAFAHIKENNPALSNVFVPKPFGLFEYRGTLSLSMERVWGHSLKTYEIISRHLSHHPKKKKFSFYSDSEIEEIAKNEHVLEQCELDFLATEGMDAFRKFFPNSKEYVAFEMALAELKKHGIVHSDLHSGNIMMSHDGKPFLIDFGSVRISSQSDLVMDRIKTRIGEYGGFF